MARKLNAQAIETIKRRMLAVPKKLRAAAEDELRRTGERMAEDMRRDAPVDDGDLRDSIHVRAIDDAADQVGVRVASSDWKANLVEFGTSRSPAQPFFFPNYRRHRRKVKAGLTRVLRRAAKDLEP